MSRVLFAKYCLGGGDSPVDVQGVVQDGDSSVRFGVIELVALVLEDGFLRQDGKTVGESFWNEELQMVFLRQFHCHMPPVGGAVLADVYGDIQYGSSDTAYQFALGEGWLLEVQPSHDPVAGHALVVLHESDGTWED